MASPATTPAAAPAPGFLRIKQAMQHLSIGRAKLYDLINNDPTFPEPIRLSSKCVGWMPRQLDAWLESKLSESAKSEVRQGGRI